MRSLAKMGERYRASDYRELFSIVTDPLFFAGPACLTANWEAHF